MEDYVDIGSSDSEEEDDMRMDPMMAMDSDEEEEYQNSRILKMLSDMTDPPTTQSKQRKRIENFEAEMEAELDRRANWVEAQGGMEHQRSLSRSSSSSSLHSNPPGGSGASTSAIISKRSSSSPTSKKGKKVKFADDATMATPTPSTAVGAGPEEDKPPESEFYDKIYFDSDEDENEEEGGGEGEPKSTKKKKNRKVLTNDELFYDPESDQADQAWMDKQRRKFHTPKLLKGTKKSSTATSSAESGPAGASTSGTSSSTPNEIPLPKTDAVLNCPACFTVLCMDCQRHEFYTGQYRAMFVMNCKIDTSETLTVPLKADKKKGKVKGKWNKDKQEDGSVPANIVSANGSDKFSPVRCTICSTQVAVYDCEEIYHFFNCLASHP